MSPSPPDHKQSFVAETLIDELGKLLPPDQSDGLKPYRRQLSQLDGDPEGERRRADACLAWVHDVTESAQGTALGRLAARVLEDAREVEEAVDAALLALAAPAERSLYPSIPDSELPPGFRLNLNRSMAAVKTVDKLARKEGWSEVPWRDLLDRVFTA
jgi:hypothetical protein